MGDPPLRRRDDLSCHLLGHAAVGQAQDGDVDETSELGHVGGEHGPYRIPPGSGDIVADDIVARRDEVPRQDAAHIAEPDEANRRHSQSSFCSSARTASSDLRAETPAGAPQ